MNDTKLDVIKGEVYGHISRKVEDAVSNDVKKSFKDRFNDDPHTPLLGSEAPNTSLSIRE